MKESNKIIPFFALSLLASILLPVLLVMCIVTFVMFTKILKICIFLLFLLTVLANKALKNFCNGTVSIAKIFPMLAIAQ